MPVDQLTSAYNSYMDPMLDSGSPFELPEDSPAIGRGIDSLELKGTWYYAPRLDFLGRDRPGSIDPHVDPGAIDPIQQADVVHSRSCEHLNVWHNTHLAI